MHRRTHTMIVYATILVITGCATLHRNFETPTVTVSTIRALPTDSIAPRFEIGLHIVNPNRSPLKLHGIAYSLKLEGYKILTGVSNNLPTIDGYGEGEVTLIAAASLLSGIRFFAELLRDQPDAIAYELEAKLDLGGLRPTIHVGEKGAISLSGQSR